MANDTLTTSALLLGGGLAGYAVGHWLDHRTHQPTGPSPEEQRAEPVSSPAQVDARNARPARGGRRWSREGRTLLRDGAKAIEIVRVDLGDHRFALSPHETDVLAERLVRLLNGRNARGKTPWYRERWLVEERCGYRAWLFWTGAPPETAAVGDVWTYIEKPMGEIVGRRRFRTTAEGHRYAKAALKRALERAGKFDCYE
ncbi:MAG: hypothetical protein KC464_28425 [Myxococcales bacterium]|nr:hypothetical protein [Myxococcales bacterium]